MYYVYLLRSIEDKSKTYIGYSSDLKRRVREHNKVSKSYTGKERWILIYYEAYLNKEDAIERERRLKDDGRARYQLLRRVDRSLKEE